MRRKLFYLLMPVVAVVAYLLLGSVFLRCGLNPIVSTLIADGTMALLAFLYLRRQPVPVQGDGRSVFGAPAKPVLWAGLVAVWLFGQITAAWVLATFGDAAFANYDSKLHDVTGWLAVGSLFLTLFVAPLCEELLVRGVVFGSWRKLNPWFAFLGSSLLFAVLHGTMTHFVPTLLCGMLMAVAFSMTGSIWRSVVLHIGYNLGAAVLGSMSLPDVLFTPGVFILIDVAIFVWLCFEYRHALETDTGKLPPDVMEEVPDHGETEA